MINQTCVIRIVVRYLEISIQRKIMILTVYFYIFDSLELVNIKRNDRNDALLYEVDNAQLSLQDIDCN